MKVKCPGTPYTRRLSDAAATNDGPFGGTWTQAYCQRCGDSHMMTVMSHAR